MKVCLLRPFFLSVFFIWSTRISFSKYVLSRYPLYSRLTKTTAKKPCFSKSGDTAAIGARQELLRFFITS
ncbi:hypothetical protein J2X17_002565 [Flavobacterium aquidurense]|nr:hypothetical protein [Flavobacterium aquidurense]